MTVHERYTQASLFTREELSSIAHSRHLRELSQLSLPQIDAAVNLVSQMAPAGTIPRVILNSLAALPGRYLTPETARRDTHLLFESLENLTIFGAAFAAPATIIWAYQNLLKLAGKDPESAFPQGTWQFYVNYALREDTARHTHETHGFDTVLNTHHIRLSTVNRLTAWVMAASHCLHQYHDLLRNEWRERVYLHQLASVTATHPQSSRFAQLYRQWELQRPYGRGQDARPHDNFPAYRRIKFNAFLERAMNGLTATERRDWVEQVRLARESDLPDYQRQMSVLNYLSPGRYGDERTAIPLEWAQIGLIYQGCYYLIPACAPNSSEPASPETMRSQIMAIVNNPARPTNSLRELARTRRAALTDLQSQLNPVVREEWEVLRLAPILINFDQQPANLGLSELRQAERGLGSQAMTIFDTGRTFVFDQSHIFFDGTWGAAVAEILTNEALSWAVYLQSLPPAMPADFRPTALVFPFTAAERALLAAAPKVPEEVNAETDQVKIRTILHLRRLFKLRNDLIHLTVNDILILYRAIHAATYRPDEALIAALQAVQTRPESREAATLALATITNEANINPAVLIPVDASQQDPQARVHPVSFLVPLEELKLLELHREALAALEAYQEGQADRAAAYRQFDQLQRNYLTALAGCGVVFRQAKQIANAGQSTAVSSIKLLAHIPPALQQWLDNIPGRFDALNDIIKGREVFSNIGAVAPSSSLTRFLTAKDDNDQKWLAWGVLTDAQKVMRITLRDFRPHVQLLVAQGHQDLAAWLIRDYLEAYARGLNQYVHDLYRITLASRETRTTAGEQQLKE